MSKRPAIFLIIYLCIAAFSLSAPAQGEKQLDVYVGNNLCLIVYNDNQVFAFSGSEDTMFCCLDTSFLSDEQENIIINIDTLILKDWNSAEGKLFDYLGFGRNPSFDDYPSLKLFQNKNAIKAKDYGDGKFTCENWRELFYKLSSSPDSVIKVFNNLKIDFDITKVDDLDSQLKAEFNKISIFDFDRQSQWAAMKAYYDAFNAIIEQIKNEEIIIPKESPSASIPLKGDIQNIIKENILDDKKIELVKINIKQNGLVISILDTLKRNDIGQFQFNIRNKQFVSELDLHKTITVTVESTKSSFVAFLFSKIQGFLSTKDTNYFVILMAIAAIIIVATYFIVFDNSWSKFRSKLKSLPAILKRGKRKSDRQVGENAVQVDKTGESASEIHDMTGVAPKMTEASESVDIIDEPDKEKTVKKDWEPVPPVQIKPLGKSEIPDKRPLTVDLLKKYIPDLAKEISKEVNAQNEAIGEINRILFKLRQYPFLDLDDKRLGDTPGLANSVEICRAIEELISESLANFITSLTRMAHECGITIDTEHGENKLSTARKIIDAIFKDNKEYRNKLFKVNTRLNQIRGMGSYDSSADLLNSTDVNLQNFNNYVDRLDQAQNLYTKIFEDYFIHSQTFKTFEDQLTTAVKDGDMSSVEYQANDLADIIRRQNIDIPRQQKNILDLVERAEQLAEYLADSIVNDLQDPALTNMSRQLVEYLNPESFRLAMFGSIEKRLCHNSEEEKHLQEQIRQFVRNIFRDGKIGDAVQICSKLNWRLKILLVLANPLKDLKQIGMLTKNQILCQSIFGILQAISVHGDIAYHELFPGMPFDGNCMSLVPQLTVLNQEELKAAAERLGSNIVDFEKIGRSSITAEGIIHEKGYSFVKRGERMNAESQKQNG